MSYLVYGFSTPIVAAGEAISVGDMVCVIPSDPYVFYVATAANMATAGEWAGISLADATEGNQFPYQGEGIVGHDVSGLGAGAAGDVYIDSAGRLSRTVSSYRVGYVNSIGDVLLNRGTSSGGISPTGAADTVFQTNSAGTAAEWEKIFNANVDNAAAIAGTKIAPQFGAQDVTATGYLAVGSGTVATNGAIRFANNQTIIAARNAGDTANISVLATDASNNVIVGDATNSTYGAFNATSTVETYSPEVQFNNTAGTNAVTVAVNPTGNTSVTFAAGSTPTVTNSTTGDATGRTTTIKAQDAATTGGSVLLSAGAGSTESNRGKVQIVGPMTGSVADSLPLRHKISSVVFSSDANKTLTAAEYSNPVLVVTSGVALTGTRNIVLPQVLEGTWLVVNGTTGGQYIQAITASGTGVLIANGEGAGVQWNGTNVVPILQGPAGATGATGATGSAGAAGTNATRSVKIYTSGSGTFTVPSTVNVLDYVILLGGGQGGGGGGSGGGNTAAQNSSGAGGGGGAGAPGAYVAVCNYQVSPSDSISYSVGAGGGGGAGAAGPGPISGSAGTAGSAGGATTFGSLSVAGGSGAGTGGGAGLSGSTAGSGASSAYGNGAAGGIGTAAGTGTAGSATTTGSVNAIRTMDGSTVATTWSGTYTGNTGASGGAAGTAGTGTAGGGGGGGGATVTSIPVVIQYSNAVAAQTPGAGGAGATGTNAGADNNATAGSAASGTQYPGLGGAGGGGGGGGSKNSTSNSNGGAGGNGGTGGDGWILVSYVEPTNEV